MPPKEVPQTATCDTPSAYKMPATPSASSAMVLTGG